MLVVAAGDGVLDNDGDVEGDALVASLVDVAEHGQVVLATDGSLTYTPDADFKGSDVFSYMAADGLDAPDVTDA